MKTLYISDLDGTLFNSEGEITPFTADTVNTLTGKGMSFTFATARSVYSAKPMTEMLDINVPCILMNGVSIYDIKRNKYIKNEYIPNETAERINNLFDKYNIRCFMYKINDGVLTAYFTEMTSEVMRQFAEERKRKFRKPFVQCGHFTPENNSVYFTTTGEYDVLLPLKREIETVSGSDCTFYEDTYTKKWYLEVFSSKASKANGISFLRENYGFDRVVCFGDNLNDLSMFEASDIKIAVGNAKPELKAAADSVTLANDEDGAAKWLIDNYNL